jgi:maltooligosyltrehalose trehalohydrolase
LSPKRSVDRSWALERGATVTRDGVRFAVWAPRCDRLSLEVSGGDNAPMAMQRGDDGLFTAHVPGLGAGADYQFVLSDGRKRPDPVSRMQPFGVHGASRIVDPRAFTFTNREWRGRKLRDYVMYEMHVGTFTADGTFAAAIERLPYLESLGITAVELMPVAACPGRRNWGYDGVGLYAVQENYGGPEELKAFVDACHELGMSVVLDVVYNHIGPEGNYLGDFGPYFTERYRTPWGPAINYDDADSNEVRRFVIDNALYWVTEYRIDALRLDAIHGIFDFSAQHILEEMKIAVAAEARRHDRHVYLIAESDLNDVRIVRPRSRGGYDLDAQWSDDFHHAIHVATTGGKRGYFGDFAGVSDVAKAFRDGFVYDGRDSRFRRRRHGNSSRDEPGERFVVFTQNHDQIANASAGLRLTETTSFARQKLSAAVLFFAPNLPLLFMGQEWSATSRFHYFIDHGDVELLDAVRRGRREEVRDFATSTAFADPADPATMAACVLDWAEIAAPPHCHVLRLYRDLIALRRRTPALARGAKDDLVATANDELGTLAVMRHGPGRSRATLLANFSSERRRIPLPRGHGTPRLAIFTESESYGDAPHPTPEARKGSSELPGHSAAIFVNRR